MTDRDDAVTVDVEVRLRDLDFMGHVNNAIYATYLEQAREVYFRRVTGESVTALDTVLASLSIEYERPIHVDEDVTVEVRVDDLGTSSVPMTYSVYADDERAATATSVTVFVDGDQDGAKPIPESIRAAIEARHDLGA